MKKKMMLKQQEGVAIVEFAIVLPLLLILIFGIIEFSLLLYNKAMLTNASREGARLGIVYALGPGPNGTYGDADDTTHPPENEIRQAVINYATNYLITFGSDVLDSDRINIANADGLSGEELTVTVNYRYDFLIFPNMIGLIGGSFSNLLNLQAVTKMRLE